MLNLSKFNFWKPKMNFTLAEVQTVVATRFAAFEVSFANLKTSLAAPQKILGTAVYNDYVDARSKLDEVLAHLDSLI